jgi:hypothetical protein
MWQDNIKADISEIWRTGCEQSAQGHGGEL